MKQQTTNLTVNITKKPAFNYEIIIGTNILENANFYINKVTNCKKKLIITNKTIAKLYKEKLHIENSLWLILPDGEKYKNFKTLKKIIDFCTENKLQRSDCIIAFGGGVIGDIAGFAASIYMRSIDFIQIPTTLLAQVDSSVGGKVAINHELGKNLIGSFYQPKLVLADISLLKTLNKRQLKTGLSEVIKYAFIEKSCNAKKDYNLFNFLENNKKNIYNLEEKTLIKLIKICCSLKATVVNQDEKENNLRAILNLGHTFAHSIENLTNYQKYTHGEAVAFGLKMALNLSLQKNFIDKNYYEKSINLINNYKICSKLIDLNSNSLYEEMFLDKKSKNGKINFILPTNNFLVKIENNIEKDEIIKSFNI